MLLPGPSGWGTYREPDFAGTTRSDEARSTASGDLTSPFCDKLGCGKIVGVKICIRFPLLLVLMLSPNGLAAQNQKGPPDESQPQYGAITGSVVCHDSNSPARFAVVLTIPIPVFDASGKRVTLPIVNGRDVATTNLDGRYILPKIAPGDYFVLAELDGYVSPVGQFSQDDVENLTPERIKKLAGLIPSVHVEPGKTSYAEVTLERAASISGSVTYDDGSPGIGLYVDVEPAQDVPADQQPLMQGLSTNRLQRTDDQGQYRLSGLSDGKYLVKVLMGIPRLEENPLAPEFQADPYEGYPVGGSIPIYSEKTLRKKDAKNFDLKRGEDLTGADIEVPLHGLYSINGTVVAQGSQPPIIFGSVSLQDVNDKTLKRSTTVIADGAFQFPYLPPGNYELKTTRLSDQPPYSPGHPDRGPDHTYADATITVQLLDKDLDGVTIAVPDIAKQGKH